jgi:hypothetical protein
VEKIGLFGSFSRDEGRKTVILILWSNIGNSPGDGIIFLWVFIWKKFLKEKLI